ncbi:unnamed protein product [Meganyctiphanes norvegica]|uniref:SAM domain-containing protein n=1 Tax=Meganyctiphanes norvegica TaxID=48144 RepID=A0AAV2QNV1_MEGNR
MSSEGNTDHPTECLFDFLKGIGLHHLGDYFRVLGCTYTKDLKLLEPQELNTIQLVSRRKLEKCIEHVPMQYEAPPPESSLGEYLRWYGLQHLEGFLNTIGVFTVNDIAYLHEEDLCLLRPVPRRRLLAASKQH